MSGSLRIYAQKNFVKIKNKKAKTISLKKIIKFEKNMIMIKKKINEFIYKMKRQNKIIAGVGAATKGNTLLNYCNLTSDHIDFILDRSKLKIGKYTPGSCIKIVDENRYKNFHAMIILPWNISNYLLKKFVKKTNEQVSIWSQLQIKIGLRTRLRKIFLQGCHPSIYPKFFDDYIKIKQAVLSANISYEEFNNQGPF